MIQQPPHKPSETIMMDAIIDEDDPNPYATGQHYILVTYFRGYYRCGIVFPDGNIHTVAQHTRDVQFVRDFAQALHAWSGRPVRDDAETAKARDDAERGYDASE